MYYNSLLYDLKTGSWSYAGSTIVPLANSSDPSLDFEVGPTVLRPDGTVIAFGATPYNAIYNSKSGKWQVAPNFPVDPVDGQLTCGDAPAALLPNGNVLVVTHQYNGPEAPIHVFQFTRDNQFVEQPSIPNMNARAFGCSMLILTNGTSFNDRFNSS